MFIIKSRDDVNGVIIAQNDASNPYDPNLYSRFDYKKESNGHVIYCQTAYNAATLAAASGTAAASFVAYATNGCAGFPFSELTPSKTVKSEPVVSAPKREIASERKGNEIPRRGADSVRNLRGK